MLRSREFLRLENMPTSSKKEINKIISDKKADIKFELLTRVQIQQILTFHRKAVSKQAVSNFFRKEYSICLTTQEVNRFFERLGLETSGWNMRVRRKASKESVAFREGIELSSHLKSLLEELENKNHPQ